MITRPKTRQSDEIVRWRRKDREDKRIDDMASKKNMTEEEFRQFIVDWCEEMYRMMTDIWMKWS